MPSDPTEAKLRWEDGVPISALYDDPYYSRADGLAETRHVFLAANRLPARWAGAARHTIGELGFGTGLNFLATWPLWRQTAPAGAHLTYVAFERHPMGKADMARALSLWPELRALAEAAGDALAAGGGALPGAPGAPGASLRIVPGDARRTVPATELAADTWFLDGFAPGRNPEMWEPALMQAVHDRTVPGGRFATYSAAGHVRRALQAAGFRVARVPGYGRKREMLAGERPA